jgi:RNA polymerase sigma factor (sigma-70 family)
MATASLPLGPPESDDDVSEIDRVVEQIDALRPLAFNLAFRLLRRAEDAADALQDASIQAVRAARGTTAAPREPAHFKPWFLKIVTNVALGQLRRKRPGGSVSLDEIDGDLSDSRAEQPLSVVERREQRGDVLAALLALPDAQRAALTLREYQGLTYDEIGETLGMNRGSTTALLYRARTTFRAAYEGVAARRKPLGCAKLTPLISAMLDDELEAASWTRTDSHLAACPRCTRELRMLRRSQQLHSIVPLLAPPTAWTTASHLGAVGAQHTAEIVNLVSKATASTSLIDRAAEVGRPLAAGALLGATALLPGGAPGNVASLVERGLGKLAAAVTAAGLLLVVASSGAPAPGHDAGSASAAAGIDRQVGSASGSGVTGDDGTAYGFAPSSAVIAGPSADEDATPTMAATTFPAAPAIAGQAAPASSGERAAPEIEVSEISSIVQAAAPSAASPETVAQALGPGNEGFSQSSAPPDPSGGAATGGPPANTTAGGTSGSPGSAGSSAPASGPEGSSGGTTAQTPPPDPAGGDSPPIDLPAVDLPNIDLPPSDLAVAGLPPLDLSAVELPAVDPPPIDLPIIAEGEIAVPPVDLPPVGVASIDVPPVSPPVAGRPPVDVPPIDVHAIDLPAIEVPTIQVPLAEIPPIEGTLDRTQGVVGQAVQQAGQTVQDVRQTVQQAGERPAPLSSLGDTVPGTLEETGAKSIDSSAAVSAGGGGQPAASLDVSATTGAPATNGTASVAPAANASAGASTGQPNGGASASVQAGAETNGVTTSVNASTGVAETTMSIEAAPSGTSAASGLTMAVEAGAPGQSATEHGSPSTAKATVNANLDSGGSSAGSSSSSAATNVSASVDTGAGSSGNSDSSGSTSVSASIDTGSSSAGNSDSSNSSSTSISVSVDTGSSGSGNSDNSSTSISVSIDTGSSGSGTSDSTSGNSTGVSVGGVSVGVSLP